MRSVLKQGHDLQLRMTKGLPPHVQEGRGHIAWMECVQVPRRQEQASSAFTTVASVPLEVFVASLAAVKHAC